MQEERQGTRYHKVVKDYGDNDEDDDEEDVWRAATRDKGENTTKPAPPAPPPVNNPK